MAYKANVQTLCNKLGLVNPIREEDLHIARVLFREYLEGPRRTKTFTVEATDMNLAGRLFLQSWKCLGNSFGLASIKKKAEEFFTPELWNDCGPDKRPLVWGIKVQDWVKIIRK